MYNTKAIKTWLKALRSGKYKQHRGAFKGHKKNSFCCLGVAGACFPNFIKNEADTVSFFNYLWNTRAKLESLNDKGHRSFRYIADWVGEENEKRRTVMETAYTIALADMYPTFVIPAGYEKKDFRPAKKNELFLDKHNKVATAEEDHRLPRIILNKIRTPVIPERRIKVARGIVYEGPESWVRKQLAQSYIQPGGL